MKELLRQQLILRRFGEFALNCDDLDEILTEACRLVGEAMGTDLAKVVELQEDNETLVVRAGVGWEPGVVGRATIQAVEDTSEAYALKTGEPMISPDIGEEKRFRYPQFLIENGVKAVANVIILGGSGRLPFGILQVDSRIPRHFTDDNLTFLQIYANLLAGAVHRLRTINEVRQGEERLRESEARLARAISAAGMSTWEWDTVHDTFHFSRGYEALHGQEPGALPSLKAFQMAIHPDDWPAVEIALDRALAVGDRGSLEVEFQVVLPDEACRWLRLTGSVELDKDGVPSRIAGVTQDITSGRAAEGRIAHMALHDALTGLMNRRTLRERLENALSRSERGEGCAVLALDLNRFKEVNDTLGHAVGDAVLCSVATRILDVVRETDVVARPGGDEFVVIQFGLHQPYDAEVLATRLITRLNEPHLIDGLRVATGVSIGIAVAPADGIEVEQVLRCADLALYGAKKDDEVRFRFFEPSMQARAQDRRHLIADIREALVRQEFQLYYQPLVDLTRNKILGFEALVRWQHPVRGLVSPDTFIGAAEETGLILPLGEWILFKACADAVEWPAGTKVAVNLSAVQFSKGNLLQMVAAALEESGLRPECLELEITESLLLQDTDGTLVTLRQLHELGVSISMDDFGVGYSSLSYISRFPFDKVKIDRSFVAKAGPGTTGAAIIRAVAELCKSLGIITTAEGIETHEQLQQVSNLGCTEGQGYLFARPLPLPDARTLLMNWS